MSDNGHPLLVLLVCLLKSFKELFIYQTLTKGHPLLSGEPLFSEASAEPFLLGMARCLGKRTVLFFFF